MSGPLIGLPMCLPRFLADSVWRLSKD